MSTSDVSIPELKEIADVAIQIKRPLMIWGPPGIGKSEAIQQIGDKYGRPVVDIRLLLLDPTDLRGLPWLVDNPNKPGEKIVKWFPLGELPQDGTSLDNAILLLEELPAAPPMMQAAAYQLVLDRRVGEYHLPPGVDIIAAGNRLTDRASTFKMPSPLANRFIHVQLKPEWNAWKHWAFLNNVHPEIIAFLNEQSGNNLMKFDPTSPEQAFASPRTWVYTSDVLNGSKNVLSTHLIRTTVQGCIGEVLGAEFMEWRRFADSLPSAAGILSGQIKTASNLTEMSAKFLVASNLVFMLKEFMDRHRIKERMVEQDDTDEFESIRCELDSMVENFLKFSIRCLKGEISMYAVRMALKEIKLPIRYGRIPVFSEFVDDFGELIIQ